MGDSRKRSLFKTASWRVTATLTTTAIVYVITQRLFFSIGIGSVDLLFKLVLYFLHERIWEKIRWGKHPLAQIRLKKQDLAEEDIQIITDRLRRLGYL